jgi:hypothetical protein
MVMMDGSIGHRRRAAAVLLIGSMGLRRGGEGTTSGRGKEGGEAGRREGVMHSWAEGHICLAGHLSGKGTPSV